MASNSLVTDVSGIASAGPLRRLPTKFALPLVGESLAFLKDPAGFLAARARELGPVFQINVFGHRTACFWGPEAFHFFLDERYFSRASASPAHVQAILNPNAVPFLDGLGFKRRKALLMQAFTPDALDGYLVVLERVLTRYARRWANLGTFAWVPELTAFGMTVATSLFLGTNPDDDDPLLGRAFMTAFQGFLSVPINLPFTKYGQALAARDALRERIEHAIDEHEASTSTDALARLIDARLPNGDKLSREEIRIETFHFVGAYLAVIGALSFLAMFLGRRPDVKERLRREIREVMGTGPVTLQGLAGLEYLGRVTRESRRAEPVLPLTFFANVKEPCAYGGIRIPAGIKAIGCIGATLQDDKTFLDPRSFDPDRWLSERATDRQHAAWVPHGGGGPFTHHRCAGERLADLMLSLFSVVMLREYDWTFPRQDFSPTAAALFATPRGGLQVQLQRRAPMA